MVAHGYEYRPGPCAQRARWDLRVESVLVILVHPESSASYSENIMPYMAGGPTITVLSGQTKSLAMIHDYTVADADQVVIKSPAVLPEVATIEVSYDFDTSYAAKYPQVTLAQATAAATWVPINPAVPLGGAGVPVTVDTKSFLARAWRLSLGGAAAADRVFTTEKRVMGF